MDASLQNGMFAQRNNANNPRRRKITDAEVLARLKTIVTIGDPDKKYHKVEKIGSGASGSVFTAIGWLKANSKLLLLHSFIIILFN
jgi:hypothetical protein